MSGKDSVFVKDIADIAPLCGNLKIVRFYVEVSIPPKLRLKSTNSLKECPMDQSDSLSSIATSHAKNQLVPTMESQNSLNYLQKACLKT